MPPLFTTPLLGFAVTITLLIGVTILFPRWNLLDFPEKYGHKRPPLPYPGGVAAVLAFMLIFCLTQEVNTQSLGLIAAVCIIAVMSFIDDRIGLPAPLRLCIQIFSALIIFATGDCTGGRICSLTSPVELFGGSNVLELNIGPIPLFSIAATVVWLVLTTNALNWFDGIPGQVTVLSTLGFMVIGLLSVSSRVGQPELALLSFTLAGISAASAMFDLPPKIVLGDTGSMFFGLMLGVLTIYAGGKVATAFLVLGVPIIDLILVFLKRIKDGRSPFKGSMHGEHLHHRLLHKGWQRWQIILLTSGIGILFGSTALFLNTLQKVGAAGLLGVVMLLLWKYSKPSISAASGM